MCGEGGFCNPEVLIEESWQDKLLIDAYRENRNFDAEDDHNIGGRMHGFSEKLERCPHCNKAWASQAHYDLQSCNCIHQTDGASAYDVLVAVADCARRWEPDARIIGNVRAADILIACNRATSLLARHGEENER